MALLSFPGGQSVSWFSVTASSLWSPTDVHRTLVTQGPRIPWAPRNPPRISMKSGLHCPLSKGGLFKTFWILSYFTCCVTHIYQVQRDHHLAQKLRDLRGSLLVNDTDRKHANVFRTLFPIYYRWRKVAAPRKVAAVCWTLSIRGKPNPNPSPLLSSDLIFMCWSNTLFGGSSFVFPQTEVFKDFCLQFASEDK